MMLRPYQYYAVEAIVEQVKASRKNGYIWHTTGSGKTLTSFKAAQMLTQMPKVERWCSWWTAPIWIIRPRGSSTISPRAVVDGTNNTSALVSSLPMTTPS